MWRKQCANYHSFSQDNDTLQLITKTTALLLLSLCSFAKQILTRMNTGRLSRVERCYDAAIRTKNTAWEHQGLPQEQNNRNGTKDIKAQVLQNISQVLHKQTSLGMTDNDTAAMVRQLNKKNPLNYTWGQSISVTVQNHSEA